MNIKISVAEKLLAGATFIASCGLITLEEKEFYKNNPDRESKITSLEGETEYQKWRIYRYGMDKISPAPIEMAKDISTSGKPIVDEIITELEKTNREIDYTYASYVFLHVQKDRRYNICSDSGNHGETGNISG
ncbi:hypothetical protein Q1W73_08095 [Asticcacaulis sp. ZE23SCel15]|uniref:hypothetical protein n=1 Tax=Asticcacaulis sp. ZE23SCel15 TaxID=3059027 RepID=UPI00265EC5CF|nr:hypothetical protein [Asticcacaulis sp. ZE23SCel15]WKL58936.1 hypothetical protein Q1W73_08095 [Asticcacaulis sp. ZE23SCel15]